MRRRPLGLWLIPLFITTMTLADSSRRDPGDDALVAAKLLRDAGYGGLFQAQRVGDSIANFNVVEASIPQLQAALASGEVSSGDLVALYLLRIARYEPVINAAISINPNAFAHAQQLDAERARGQIRGPLHGIPIAVKDNINTTDMPTTGGALAFEGIVPPYEATLISNLKGSGAIIIAKTVLTELANWVTNGMPTNYSAVGGFGFNPYDPRVDPRTVAPFNDGRPALATGGSSGGGGTASSFWAANVGTETSGSILSPASANMLAGIKPTVGRVSGYGVIPIVADQDIAGPLARTVTDAAILLGALEGARPDPNDPATNACTPPPGRDYTQFLRTAGLRGARIGIPRAFYYDAITVPGLTGLQGGRTPEELAALNEAITIMRAEGATIVDPANIPSVVDGTPANNLLLFGTCTQGRALDTNCSSVLKFGFKRDFNAYLASLGPGAPIKTLTELRTYNSANVPRNAIKYGQDLLNISDEVNLSTDRARYDTDRAKDIYLTNTHGIGEIMSRERLDALIFGGNTGANVAARPGFPTVIVPFALVPNNVNPPFPESFQAKPRPFGVSFTSTACNEPRLLELAYAFEQVTRRRVPPASTP
jgi:amidase